MTQRTATVREPDLTLQEAAEALRISDYRMRAKVAAGEFPNAYRAGNRLRIPAADLADYRERNRIKPAVIETHSARSEAARRAAATRRRTA